jgi:hypothetical protein
MINTIQELSFTNLLTLPCTFNGLLAIRGKEYVMDYLQSHIMTFNE